MTNLFFFLIIAIFWNSSGSKFQAGSTFNSEINSNKTTQTGEQRGILYFSFDGGKTWKNKSHGLPDEVEIGLGGIAVSGQMLGIATKGNGIYLFNFELDHWEAVPTEKNLLQAGPGAMAIHENNIYAGTQQKGVFCTGDKGKTWQLFNGGLTNLTIRRFCEFSGKLYVCTNDGFYSKNGNRWQLEYGQASLQVNGATSFRGNLFLATNRGIFKKQNDTTWVNSSPEFNLHNISSDKDQIYAMTYNKLLMVSKYGVAWQNLQSGLPKDLYTFNVVPFQNSVLAGQWDGVYKREMNSQNWEYSGMGLPAKFPVTNLVIFNNLLVLSTSKR